MTRSTTGPELRRELERRFHECDVVRSFNRSRYEPGDRLEYEITGVAPAGHGRMAVEVDRFVGGGFAGQVYRVKLTGLTVESGEIDGLVVGRHYAIKVLRPPSGFAQAFRDLLFFLGYQGRFGAQVNPDAVRVGVLWQKLIRRAAARRFGRDDAVCDTFATFHDAALHSFGEINEWIDGRIWKFEVDDRLFERWDFDTHPPPDHQAPEFVHKKLFMRDLVALLHEMGAPELARQYEWWTCKSQPNALKRLGTDADPGAGLTAVDFRAGLTLLPFLPMSPADIWLILRGLVRGRIVQFDRSDPGTFTRFIERNHADFEDLIPAVDELRAREASYRRSLPDITRNHVRFLFDAGLRRSIRSATITGWRNLGWLDDGPAREVERRPPLYAWLLAISLVPGLGGFAIRSWGVASAREHLRRCLRSRSYLERAWRASRIETLIDWHRDGRMSDERARRLVDRPIRYWLQRIFLGWMRPTWHRSLTEPAFFWSRITDTVGFVNRFLRVPEFRESWLLDEVRMGCEEGMLTPGEAETVSEQIKDPYIQKYLRCLAVHICTVPVTQVVMVVAGAAVVAYCLVYRHMSWPEAMGYGSATAAAIQLLPISPGSISRGIFVIYLMIRERDIKNYYIAAPISFIHVLGYLAFPLQMVNHNPALARFMAGRWAKRMVRIVPVFGESGGLLEHGVFDTFFNLPISIRRGFRTDPLRWALGTVAVIAVLTVMGLLGYARVWEWRQPELRLQNVQIASISPYRSSAGGDVHWSRDGVRVRFAGMEEPVDYPASHWNEAVTDTSRVDAVIRRSFRLFGDEYDGLRIEGR